MNESRKLEGRNGVVTGGAGPLGWALTRALAEQGAQVIAVDLPERCEARKGEAMSPGIDVYSADLTSEQELEEVVHRATNDSHGLSFLINNAALTGTAALDGYTCAFDEQSDAAFDLALEINLAVPFRLCRRLAPALRRSGLGSIVNISSIYGLVGPDLGLYEGTEMGNPAGYAASKGGLVQLTRYLSTVLAPDIRVNCLAPGGLARAQDPSFVERYTQRTPLGRMGTEDDVIGPSIWLVSGDSAYVTGQVIAIDGGWTAR